MSALAYAAIGTTLAAAVVATAVMYTVSTGLDVIAAGMHNRRNPLEIWVEIAAADSNPTAALYVAGYLLAVLSNGRPWLAVVMMVPVAAIQLALTRSVQLMEQAIAAVESMADVVDRRDPYTFQHSQSVADHAVRTARRLQLPDREVELIRLAARVHDLGKIAVPDEVLHKHGRLTEAEFEVMKKHPETGVEILAKFPEYKRGRELVLAHRKDGWAGLSPRACGRGDRTGRSHHRRGRLVGRDDVGPPLSQGPRRGGRPRRAAPRSRHAVGSGGGRRLRHNAAGRGRTRAAALDRGAPAAPLSRRRGGVVG